jgi:hypothetical protein
MAHMQREILKSDGYEIETDRGCSYFIPSEVLAGDPAGADLATIAQYQPENVDGRPIRTRIVRGYFGRWTAPGYLDCTDWEFATSKRELLKSLSA